MPSITTWNRLEPRPRTTDLGEALAARVRDPAWLLARQWQLGEFQGEDAGSPAYVRIAATVGKLQSWGVGDDRPHRISPAAPLERYAVSEPRSSDDLTLAVELGQTFDRFLGEVGAADLRGYFVVAYPIAARADDDPRTARLRALWRDRAIDGVALWRSSVAPPPTGGGQDPPRGVPGEVPSERRHDAARAIRRLRHWVATTVRPPGTADAPAWRPGELDQRCRVYGKAPGGATAVLEASPDRHGDLAWHAFEQSTAPAPIGAIGAPPVEIRRAVIPGHVRFRGMPNERFWDFEDRRVDVAAIRPDRRNLASMILVDFMLVHGNDWYLVPFEQPAGTLCTTTLTMVDVFGGSTDIPRADAGAVVGPGRFSMFSTTRTDGAVADFFLVPSTAATSVLESAPLEQVRFLRDETANLAWAVESAVETPLGRAQLGADRAPPPTAPAPTSEAPLRYRLQSSVPPHWFPFQPVKLAGSDEIALERAALLPLDQGAAAVPVPRGKILAPTAVPAGTPYRVREEQIPREGTRVTRLVRRSRGADGTTHVWVARTRSVGTGEGWSGLRFDLATPTEPPSE